MLTEKNNNSDPVLVAALDWGLGHATRCIPLIRLLLKQGYAVSLAGSGASGQLLHTEFPDLPYETIPSHTIQYARSKQGLLWAILRQIPQLLQQIRQEKAWLHQYLQQHPTKIVVSDNRYGLHHPTTHNILLTHQLGLRSGWSPLTDKILQRLLIRLLKNFDACWVPDHADEPNLSGELGHPKYTPPIPVQYIGPLTRFKPTQRALIPNKITIVLSGPEPQRTLLEEKCLNELSAWNGEVELIRGIAPGTKKINAPNHWKVTDLLSGDALQQAIEEADWIIARSGYSTLMDLHALNKKSILIPTPGQPEQEYLANWLTGKKQWYCINQSKDLLVAMKHAQAQPTTNGNFSAR